MSLSSDNGPFRRDTTRREPSTGSDAVGFADPVRDERGAVEPVAALVALIAVGAGLGLYTVALDVAAPDRDRHVAETTLDRVEREATVGGIVAPDRLPVPDPGPYAGATVELVTRHGTWRRSGGEAPPNLEHIRENAGTERRTMVGGDANAPRTLDVAETTVTVRVAPGENVRGTLRTVVRR